jgi:hypothetical protein
MRILIYALPRTGSNNLTHYIANSLHYREIIEPYNEERFWDKDLTESDIWKKDNVVVKMMFGQGGYWHKDLKDKFDKIVVLYRENTKEQAESYAHATKSTDWHARYTYNPANISEEEYLEAYKSFDDRMRKINRLNEFTVKYEDLYISGTDRDRLDEYVGITNKSFRFILDSSNRYRRNDMEEKRTLI